MIEELNENIIGKLAIVRIPFDYVPVNYIFKIVGINTKQSKNPLDIYINGKWYDYDILLKKVENINYEKNFFFFHACTREFLVKEPLVYNLQLYYYAPHHVLELIDNN